MFAPSFAIDGRPVGSDAPCYFIAEAGVAHFGDPGKARALVDLAADSGADAFKTQAFTTDRLVAGSLPEWRDRLRPKEVGFEFIAAMKRRCDERRITFLCTAHEESVLPWLDELQVPAFKIGSGERGNFQYLRTIASRGKPIVLSTGMYDGDDVRRTLEVLAEAGSREVALLHCVTSYPTPPEQVNLRAMDTLRRLFGGPVGYSDHTSDHLAVLAAVARGAKLIEKHISLDFNVPNAQDWKVSAGPHDLAKLIGDIRTVEASLGREEKAAQPCEQAATHWALKGLYSAVDLAAGDVLTAETIVAKRPAGGIPAAEFDRVVGRRVARSLRADQPIEWDALA